MYSLPCVHAWLRHRRWRKPNTSSRRRGPRRIVDSEAVWAQACTTARHPFVAVEMDVAPAAHEQARIEVGSELLYGQLSLVERLGEQSGAHRLEMIKKHFQERFGAEAAS